MDEERLARRWGTDDPVQVLRARVADGSISMDRVHLAALLGDDVARDVEGGWHEDCGCGAETPHHQAAHVDGVDVASRVRRISAVSDRTLARTACDVAALAMAKLAVREGLLDASGSAYVRAFDDFTDGDFNSRPDLRLVKAGRSLPPLLALEQSFRGADLPARGQALAEAANWMAGHVGAWRVMEAMRNEVASWALGHAPRTDWP